MTRINGAYVGQEFEPHPDVMCHELPEYWACGLYFKPHTGRLPDDHPHTDLSVWEVHPAPPAGPSDRTLSSPDARFAASAALLTLSLVNWVTSTWGGIFTLP